MSTGDITINNPVERTPTIWWNITPNIEQLGAYWHVSHSNRTLALIGSPDYAIVVDGELEIHVTNKQEHISYIQSTNDLFMWGITTDAQLLEFARNTKGFVFISRPIFKAIYLPTMSLKFTGHNLLDMVRQVAVDK